MPKLRILLLVAAAAASRTAAAQSYDENASGRALYALADLRAVAADGERSWLDGGFGRTRFGGTDDRGVRLRPYAVEGDLVWQPRLTWSLDATVAATAQQGQEHAVDVSEAFLRFRHAPINGLRLSGRAGLFWPPVSTEHSGPAWTVTETITPSAINSWIGEEVKVGAAEASASVPLAGGRLSLTAAVFGFNDTAGTLLTFRGWALHDEKATAFGRQPLPPLNDFMRYAQAPFTSPVIELDNRPGFYGKLGWGTRHLRIDAFYYDNRANPEAFDARLQWGWRTRFGNLTVQLHPDAATTVTSQAMVGTTQMGFPQPDRPWVDTSFRSAFLLVTRRFGQSSSLSGRVEEFGTHGRGSLQGPESSEDGWAGTIAVRHAVGEHLTILGEVLHVDSDRDERLRVGVEPQQDQTVAQVAARVQF